MDLQLKGKCAVVTGASRGIGKAIAQALACEGVDVVIAARGMDALAQAAEEIAKNSGRRIVPITADMGEDASVAALVRDATGVLGRVDILVNNAATMGGSGGRFPKISTGQLMSDANIKVAGYLRAAQAAAPAMIEGKWGRIINIGGISVRRAGAMATALRNAAIAAMSGNLAEQLGRHGITVNTVHPGTTRVGPDDHALEKYGIEEGTIGRAVRAEEIAWLVTVLASPLSAAVNGESFLSGGLRGAIRY
ncbi:MAG: SDR family NAD(P)-dependent oxidoreductase [Hyphomonadaceae bacterium]